ncbi:MAG: 16S rRNA (guanine(527)-N(7))-methyltransferase RsmG, partial [Desulfuromonadales bacterium]|nr:16S rRNA (guanine(527)-N(7))-methyltransferase RsmG [Desulfuromonadales bacterium]NIS39897.1 16S rRNA (guanine(527)-N(7))-methyltransferase RsmG [Desulfuromonadales bacterium]
KIRFQKHMARKLGLGGYEAWHGRAEALPDQGFSAGGFDLIVARAFSSLEKLVGLALPCLRPTGRIVAMKGPEGEGELEIAADSLEKHGLYCREVVRL